jgi:hypothetical protein
MFRKRISGQEVYFFLPPGGLVGEKVGIAALRMAATTALIGALRSIGV